MRKTVLCAALLLLALPATAGRGPHWKESLGFYKSSQVKQLDTLALGSVSVRVGMQLERLTLLSGEGHTGKKIAGGVLAVGLGMLGGSGNTAAREPLEEHMDPADAQKIAEEVVQSVEQHFNVPGVKVVMGDAVTSTPAYQANHDGVTASAKDTLTVKTGRFSPEYFFGIWMQPAGGYAYRGPKGAASRWGMGGMGAMYGDKSFSPNVRAATGAQALATVDVFLVNTRKDFRVQEMKVRVLGPMRNGGTDNMLLDYNLEDAEELAVPVSGSHKDNYPLWQTLRPQFEAKLDELSAQLATTMRR